MSNELEKSGVALIVNEGACLDQRKWHEWLDLYTEDAYYWLPAWDDEHTITDDPDTQMSLIYYGNRSGLDDRVFRLETDRSLASSPLPRTCHMTANYRFEPQENGELKVHSTWNTHSYKLKETTSFYGHQEHLIRQTGEGPKIAGRKVIVLNDMIPHVLDIYSV